MGTSYTPTFRIETIETTGAKNTYTWDSKRHGRPNTQNLETWRTKLNASFQPGGVNFHITQASRVVPHISRATLVRQSTGSVVAEARMPPFEVA